jgi:hypothetical protein
MSTLPPARVQVPVGEAVHRVTAMSPSKAATCAAPDSAGVSVRGWLLPGPGVQLGLVLVDEVFECLRISISPKPSDVVPARCAGTAARGSQVVAARWHARRRGVRSHRCQPQGPARLCLAWRRTRTPGRCVRARPAHVEHHHARCASDTFTAGQPHLRGASRSPTFQAEEHRLGHRVQGPTRAG